MRSNRIIDPLDEFKGGKTQDGELVLNIQEEASLYVFLNDHSNIWWKKVNTSTSAFIQIKSSDYQKFGMATKAYNLLNSHFTCSKIFYTLL